ncbi:DUF4352 domain-containing protein [Wenyingzhuangia sp. IMCC45533]
MKNLIFLSIFSLFLTNKKIKLKKDVISLKSGLEVSFKKIQRFQSVPTGRYSTMEASRGNKFYILKMEFKNKSKKTTIIDFNKITIVDKEKEAQFKSSYVTRTGTFSFVILKESKLKAGGSKGVNLFFIYDENKNPKYLKIQDEIIKVPYK